MTDWIDHQLNKRAKLDSEYRRAIAPVVNACASAQAMMLPTILVSKDGVERIYSPQQQKVLDGYKALMDSVTESFRPDFEKIDSSIGLRTVSY
jgi:hypothetical protein